MAHSFADRRDAGRQLAEAVKALNLSDPVVLALPRGGVPVGLEVARALQCPLDVLLVRKVGAPGHEEYGIGALVDGTPPQLVIDEAAARMVGANQDYIDRQVAKEQAENERRRTTYRSGPSPSLQGRTAIVVDDGIATGGTVRAALAGLAQAKPARVVLAVPLAPSDVLSDLRALCDELVCLSTPEPYYAVGAWYRDFAQTSDREVIDGLAEARAWTAQAPG
jgi:predicted phosphoribosyltransferase